MNQLAEPSTTSVDPKSVASFYNVLKSNRDDHDSSAIQREIIDECETINIHKESVLFRDFISDIGSTVVFQPLLYEGNSTYSFVEQFELSHWQSMLDNNWQELLKKLLEYGSLSEGWNGYSAPSPSVLALRNSRSFLCLLSSIKFFPNRLKPSVVGGIAFTFRHAQRKVYVEFFNDGNVSSLFSDSVSDPIIRPSLTTKNGYWVLIKDIQEYLNG